MTDTTVVGSVRSKAMCADGSSSIGETLAVFGSNFGESGVLSACANAWSPRFSTVKSRSSGSTSGSVSGAGPVTYDTCELSSVEAIPSKHSSSNSSIAVARRLYEWSESRWYPHISHMYEKGPHI